MKYARLEKYGYTRFIGGKNFSFYSATGKSLSFDRINPKKPVYITIVLAFAVLGFISLFAVSGKVGRVPNFVAFAEEPAYLRVTDDETVFYADAETQTPIFYLPYTYYVRVISYGKQTCKVEYLDGGNTVDGYVITDALFSDGLEVENPFPRVTVTTAVTATLYADGELKEPIQYLFAERRLTYYGNYVYGNVRLLFVGYNGKLGYVREDDVYPFVLSNHPNKLTFIPEETEETEDVTEKKEDVFALRTVILVILGFAGTVALFAVLAKKPRKTASAPLDEDTDY